MLANALNFKLGSYYRALSVVVLWIVSAVAVDCARAEVFGVNFIGSTGDMVTGTAGVVSSANWNNIASDTFTSGSIHSSDGAVTATLSLSGAAAAGSYYSGIDSDGGNGSLMDGYVDGGSNKGGGVSITNTISGLTGASYSVYVYIYGDASHPGDGGQYLPSYSINGVAYFAPALGNGTTTWNSTSTTVGGAFNGFVKATTYGANFNTATAKASDFGNYLEVDNVAPVGGVIKIVSEASSLPWRSPLNGFELVGPAPQIITQPAAQRLYTGGSAQFSVIVQGAAPISYYWLKDGVALSDGGNIYGSTSNILTVTNLTITDIGDYDVVITNNFGSVTSVVAHLNVVVETMADMAIDAFNKAYLVQTNGLTYYANSLTNRAPDGTWTFSLDIQGEEDAYERTQSPQQQQLVNSLCTTWLVQVPPPWAWDGYNDDIGWFALALVRGYQMTGNTSFLNAAEYGFNFAFARGWDTNYNNGGIWEEQPANTGTNAPNKTALACDSLLQTACMLYQSTSNAVYLAQAEQIYSWVRTNLFNPNTGLVYGSISTNGNISTTPNLYNQGTFVDCANLLHNITGQQVYYNDALIAVEYTRNNLTVNGIFSNGSTGLNTWAAEFGRGIGHFVKDNNLWSTYYPWMLANANAAWGCRRLDYNVSWSAWTQPTATNIDIIANWDVNAVAMTQATPASEPGLVNCTNKLSGTVIGTSGSWGGGGNTGAKVFDGNLNTFFDGPDASGDWVGLDFGVGVSNVIGQINYWPRAGYSSRMLGGYFQGANNAFFLNAVTLFTIATTPPEGGVVTSQIITNTTGFRYVRYVGPSNGSCNVAEIQFFTPNPPPVPPQITNSWDGNQLTLSWPNGSMLMEATNVTGPWTTNTGATSPFFITPNEPQKFYRVFFP